MGGAEEVLDLDKANGGMVAGNYGPVSTGKVGLMIQQKFWSFSGNDFDIMNHENKPAYKVKGCTVGRWKPGGFRCKVRSDEALYCVWVWTRQAVY